MSDVGFIDGAEGGEERGVWPLVRGEKVTVEGGTEDRERVRGGYVDLLAPWVRLAMLIDGGLLRRVHQSMACAVISFPSLL